LYNLPVILNIIGGEIMQRLFLILIIFYSNIFLTAYELKYPFLYIPGMFDNGDMFVNDYQTVKTLDGENGFYL